jgi:hypothetical protein
VHFSENTACPLTPRTHQILEETQFLSLNILMPSLDRSKHSFNIDTAVGTKDLAYAFFLATGYRMVPSEFGQGMSLYVATFLLHHFSNV